VARSKTPWPDGMSDLEAVERLQSTLVAACDGNLDLSSGRTYKEIRQPLIRREDLFDVVPGFVRAHRELAGFSAYIRRMGDERTLRREHVWDQFKPLLDRVQGKTSPPVRSSNWTGRRTATQQALVVLNVAPAALEGVDLLLSELDKPYHNRGPIDDEMQSAFEALRRLRDAIDDLLQIAEHDRPLSRQLGQLLILKNQTFRWSADTMKLMVGPLPLTVGTTALGAGVIGLLNILTKGATPIDPNILGAAAMGVHAAGASLKRPK
jgi:hypothetical protein